MRIGGRCFRSNFPVTKYLIVSPVARTDGWQWKAYPGALVCLCIHMFQILCVQSFPFSPLLQFFVSNMRALFCFYHITRRISCFSVEHRMDTDWSYWPYKRWNRTWFWYNRRPQYRCCRENHFTRRSSRCSKFVFGWYKKRNFDRNRRKLMIMSLGEINGYCV